MAIYGYTRVSTLNQSGNTSIDDQHDVIRRVAQAQYGQEPDEVFSDPAVSGSVSLHLRPEGGRMVELLKPGDVVIVSKMDRMFRSAQDALNVSEDLKSRGVKLGDRADFDGSRCRTTIWAKFFFTMLGCGGRDGSVGRLTRGCGEGLAAKRERGGYAGGRPPFGFRARGKGRTAKLVEDEREQEAIVLMRELAEEGLGSRNISDIVNDRLGLDTNHMTVYRVLNREAA